MQRHRCHSRSRRRIGRILPVLMAFLMLLLAAVPVTAQETSQQPIGITASHSVTGSVDQGDGTYAVTYQVTLTNESSTDLNTISMTPLPDRLHPFLELSPPSLEAETLYSGQSVTIDWTVSQAFPGDAGMAQLPITFHGTATDGAGAVLEIFALSTGEMGQ